MNFFDKIKDIFKPREQQSAVSRAISSASNKFQSVGNYVSKQYQQAQQQQAQQQAIAQQRAQMIQQQKAQQQAQRQQFVQQQVNNLKQKAQDFQFNRQQEQLAKGILAKEGLEKRKEQVGNILNKTNNFFAPIPDKVRPRDVIREGAGIIRDIPRGAYGEIMGSNPEIGFLGFGEPIDPTKPSTLQNPAPQYVPQTTGEKIGSFGTRLGENVVTLNATGINQSIKQGLQTLGEVPQVNVQLEAAKDWIGNNLQKLQKLEIDAEKLRKAYDTLGIKQGTDPRDAYRELVKVTHPDKGGNAEAFKVINEAYKKIQSAGGLEKVLSRLGVGPKGGIEKPLVDVLGSAPTQNVVSPVSGVPINTSETAIVPYGEVGALDKILSSLAQKAPAVSPTLTNNVKNVPEVIDKNIGLQQKSVSPLEQILQNRAKELGVTPSQQPKPIEDEFEIPTNFKQQNLEKSVKSVKDIADERAVDRLLVEGYHPGTIKNVLLKAKNSYQIAFDENYAYNYFKYVARDQGIKPDPDVKAYLKPEIKEPELPQDYEAGLDSYEPEGPLPKVPDELLEQLPQQNIDPTKEVKNIDQILQPQTKTYNSLEYGGIGMLDEYPLKVDATPEQIKYGMYHPDAKAKELGVLQADIDERINLNKPELKPEQKIQFKPDYPLKTSALPEQLKSGMYYPDATHKEAGILQADLESNRNLRDLEWRNKEIQQNQKWQQEAKDQTIQPEAQPEVQPEVQPEAQPEVIDKPIDTSSMPIEERLSKLKDTAINAKTDSEIKYCVKEVLTIPLTIEKEVLKRYSTFPDAVDDLENKNTPMNRETELIKNYYDILKEIAQQHGIEIPTRKNFWTHNTDETAKEIVRGGLEKAKSDTFGSILSKPYFAEKRTGKLTNYNKTPLAMQAYGIEALKNIKLSDEEKLIIENAANIRAEYRQIIDEELNFFEKLGKDVSSTVKKGFTKKSDVVAKNQKELQTRMERFFPDKKIKKVIYIDKDKSKVGDLLSTGFRSVSDRAELAGPKFYNDFFKPFRYVELDTNLFSAKLQKLSFEELIRTFHPNKIDNPGTLTKDQIIARLVSEHYSDQLAQAIDTFHDNSAVADFRQPHLKDLANDIFDEYVGDHLRAEDYTEKALKIIRRNQGRSLIFFNVSSSVQNLFEPARAFSLVKTKNVLKAVKRVMSGEDFVKKWGIEQTFSTALERKDVAKALSKLDKAGYAMFSATERFKDQIFLAAFEEQGLDKGLKGEELRDFIIKKFDRFGIKYGKGQTTGVFKNPVIKTALQFEQYGQKELVNLIDQINAAIKGDKGAQHFLQKYFLYSAVRIGALKATLGTIGFGGKTGTPIDMISNLASGKMGWSPSVQALITAIERVAYELGDEEDAYKEAELKRDFNRAIISGSGIPAVNQAYYKTYRGLEDILRSEHPTTKIVDETGQVRGGNVANPTSQDPFSIAKILTFGPSYDPQRQDYIERYLDSEKTGNIGEASLNKVESEIYRQKPTQEEKEAYYYDTIAKKKQANVNKDQIKDIKSGATDKKEGNFLQRLFNKDKEVEAEVITPAKNMEEQKFQNDIFTTKLDQGMIPTPEEIKYGHFENKFATDDDIANRITAFNRLAQIYNNENYSDEQKKAVFEASGATKEELDYFLIADKLILPRIQYLLPIIPADPKERLEFLANGRKTVGGKDVISSQVITYLNDRGYISKDEAEFLRNTKYDELTGEFYWTGDFGPGGGGSKRITAAQAKRMYPGIDISMFKKLSDDSFVSMLKTMPTSKTKAPTIDEILASKPEPKQKEGLWFDVR